jgi:hypothetical protein
MASLSPIVHALERAYTAIRVLNPDAQPAVITVYRHDSGLIRGYFFKSQFISRQAEREKGDPRRWDEIQIDSTILQEPARQILRTLLHEACHSIASRRGIQDTSRQGRYHNKHFAELAQEVGLNTSTEPGIGVVTPDISPATAQRYATVLQELEEALTLYQEPRSRGARGKRKTTRMIKATCPQCERIIRASQKTFDAGAIVCQPCAALFQVEDDGDQEQ